MAIRITVKETGLHKVTRLLGKISPALNRRLFDISLTRSILEMQKEVTTSSDFIKHGRTGLPADPDFLTSRRGGAGLVGSIIPDYSGLPRVASLGSDLPYAGVHEDSRRAYLLPTYDKMASADRFAEIMSKVIEAEMAAA